jgi:hypothetical protein
VRCPYYSRETYKVFVLADHVGFDRKEIDLLERFSFLWEENVIRIQPDMVFSSEERGFDRGCHFCQYVIMRIEKTFAESYPRIRFYIWA